MDVNNLRPAAPGGEALVEQVDWRTQLQSNTRQRIVNKIMETMKRCLPFSGPESLQEFKRIAVRFEEKIYTTASSQSDYVRKISLKMLTVENTSQNPSTGPSNPASSSCELSDAGASHSLLSQVRNQPQAHQQLVSQSVQNNIAPGGVPSTAGLNSNTQNMPSISQASGGNQMGQAMPSSVFSGSQSQMLGRQHVVPQQQQTHAQSYQHLYQQQQLMKPKFQHGSSSQPLVQSHIPHQANQLQSSQQHGMHNSGIVQPSLMQSASMNCLQQNQPTIQYSTSSMLQQHQQQLVTRQQQKAAVVHQQESHVMQQQLMGHLANPGNKQHEQLMGQQNSFSDRQQQQQRLLQHNNLQNLQQQRQHQQRQQHQLQQELQLMAQQYNFSNTHQQQLGAQNGVGLQQQLLLGSQSGYSGMPTNQHSVHMLQQLKVPTQQQPQPGGTGWLASQGHQSQSQAPQHSLSHMQSSATQLQHQLSLQQQSNSMQLSLQQRLQGPALLDPVAQPGQVNGSDWQEECYQKVKQMKENFLPELTELYQKVSAKLQQHDSMPQQPKSDQHDNLKMFKQMVEHLLHVLQMPKSSISPAFKENLVSYEKKIQYFLLSNRPRKPMQQGLGQPHMQNFQPGSNMDSGHGSSLGSLQQVAVGSLQQNSVNASQQPSVSSFSTQSAVNMMQPNISMQSNSNTLQHQHLKQQFQQQRHMQQKQQPMQQLPVQMHAMNDANEMKVRKGMKSGVYQQHPGAGQHASLPHQQMTSGTTFPISSSQMLQAASPQLPQHSSPQLDQQSILLSSTKTGTPLQSANSPFILPSPSTPLTPSPMPGDSEKPLSSSLSNVSHQQTLAAPSLAIGTPRLSASPLLAEFTGVDGDHGGALTTYGKPNVLEQPLERLLRVVESLSQKALSDSVSDINSVVTMIDRIAGSSPSNGSRAAVGEDLVAMSKCCLQGSNCVTQDGLTGTRKMKRYTSAMPMNVVSSVGSISDSFKLLTGSEASDLESTATSRVKRPRIEANHMLMEEIREINQRLIDTVVDISDEDTDPMTATATVKLGEGTVVKCLFRAVALSPDLKAQYASAQMSPIQPLRLLVPANYPNSSPILLDKFPVEVSKECEDLSAEAKSRFSIHLRSLSQPTSLGEIARTWDKCTRAVVCEHAQRSGGGTFSSKYGAWESCFSSA